jgi:UDP-N-acetylmuramoyl-tripeptide--D-alanyl-D-alanine ligase
MIGWDSERVAAAAGAELRGASHAGGPRRCSIDSREIQPGDLFVGLPGEHVDGGAYAEQALRAGAWGVLVAPEHARALVGEASAALEHATVQAGGAVLTHSHPLAAMQSLAREWRKALGEEGAKVVAITGSTGKTSTKDILAALLLDARELAATGKLTERGMRAEGECLPASVAGRRLPALVGGPTVASHANLNTEIGLPLTVLGAPAGTRALVLEMAMRGRGQIAALTAIAQPEVGVIVNVGPVHLEQLGTIEAVAAAKAELIAGMAPGATVVVPAGEPLLESHLRADQRTVTFGEGGDLELVGRARNGEVTIVDHTHGGERITVRPSFAQSHNLRNLLAATAAARALGVTPQGRLDVEFSALRGERVALANGIVLINDCYNANPMSMRAALDELAASEGARRVAVLGDMLELGRQERRLHREIGAYARARGVDLLLTVGPLASEMGQEDSGEGAVYSVPGAAEAAELLGRLLHAGDVVLVKGSRGMELEQVARALAAESGRPLGADAPRIGRAGMDAPGAGAVTAPHALGQGGRG